MSVVKKRGRKTCRFFKIILPFILQQHKLRIPEKFAKRLNSQVSTFVTLSIPTGLTWKVAISRSDNKLFLDKGWKSFMEENSINYGYFLEFEYRWNRHFRVHIFDLSCCEIEYQVGARSRRCPKKEEPVQVKKEDEDEGEDVVVVENAETKCEVPSFTIVVRKYNYSGNYLHIPSDFARKYLLKKCKRFIKLQAVDGKEWNIRCLYTKSKGKSVTRINGSGWKKFVEDNELDVGEMITFKLVAEKRNNLTLSFFKE